jgi:hypothetical protein
LGVGDGLNLRVAPASADADCLGGHALLTHQQPKGGLSNVCCRSEPQPVVSRLAGGSNTVSRRPLPSRPVPIGKRFVRTKGVRRVLSTPTCLRHMDDSADQPLDDRRLAVRLAARLAAADVVAPTARHATKTPPAVYPPSQRAGRFTSLAPRASLYGPSYSASILALRAAIPPSC